MKKIIKSLKALVSRYGHVNVCYGLEYRDTGALKKWLKRGRIPTTALQKVKFYIEEMEE